MAAVFDVYFDFGGSADSPETSQDTDGLGPPNIRFKQADDATIDSNDPIPIPTDASTNYSYWKHIYMKCATAPSTQVDNVKFYTDGTLFGSGITLVVATDTPTKNSGSSAGYDPATAAALMTAHTDVVGTADASTYTTGSELTVSISESSNIIDAQNETTDYVILQLAVTSDASPGDLSNETLTFQYDEI
jgi:hypothetical protein